MAALRDHLYTPATLQPLLAEVRTALLQEAEEHRKRERLEAETAALVTQEREIANIKAAVVIGRATQTLLETLEDSGSEA